MISDDAGSSENVKGSRIAMVVIGAMPGSTPTSVPISAPSRQKPRFFHVSATANPIARLCEQFHRLGAHSSHHQVANGKPSALTNSNTAKAARTIASIAFSRSRTS